MSVNSLILATSALVGLALAEDKGLATLPLALQFLATMLVTFPAAIMMQRFGRKAGFIFASLLAICGSLVAMLGIIQGELWIFSMGTILIGAFNAFGNYFRFAASEEVEDNFKSRAISYVMLGGVIAAVVGPNLANWSQWLIDSSRFAASYALGAGLYMLALLSIAYSRFQHGHHVIAGIGTPKNENRVDEIRPLRAIMLQPAYLVALVSGTIGFSVMSLLMTATPLAMQMHDFLFDDTSMVIQWHVLGMFAPAFFTGQLINRYGVKSIMLIGALLELAAAIINLQGATFTHFWVALLLLGIGWNFLFIGATTLLTTTYRLGEQGKSQAANDFILFSCVSIASLSSGALQHYFGWVMVNIAALPLLLLVLVMLLFVSSSHMRGST